MNKAKLVLLEEDVDAIENWTSCTIPHFALCTRDKDNVFHQTTRLTTCRENVICRAKRFFFGIPPSPGPYNARPATENATDRTRVLIYFKWGVEPSEEATTVNRIESALKNAKNILHYFEKVGHLKRSQLYKADHKLTDSDRIYLFEGSGEWIKYPYMLSLYMLLIRCGRFMEVGKFRTCDQFVKNCGILRDKHLKLKNTKEYLDEFYRFPSGEDRDVEYLYQVADKMMLLMENRKKLFRSVKPKELYKISTGEHGITNFCKGELTGHELNRSITDRLIELCNLHKVTLS